MNINRLSLEEENNIYNVDYPMVIIKDKNIERELRGFLGVRFGVDKVFGRILSQFGFTKEDSIVLKNIKYNRNIDSIEFEYSVNLVDDTKNKIILNYNCSREFVIYDKDSCVTCDCSVTSINDVGIRIKKLEERLNNSRIYTREYGYNESTYSIRIGGRYYNLSLKKDNDNDYRDLMIIENDRCIEEYFKNMDSGIEIDELYKNIEGYLGDIDSYNEIRLEIATLMGDKNRTDNLLVLRNGICCEFVVTRGNKKIFLNSDMEWEHDYKDRFYSVNTKGSEYNGVSYTVNADNDSILKYFIDIKVESNIKALFNDVEDTKKLVREMFPKKKNK